MARAQDGTDAGRTSAVEVVLLLGLAVAWGARFVVPGVRATEGAWPVPLDDVYIHFDYARALADGYPGAWIGGQGYSSGETAPLYALVLGIGQFFGFRDHLAAPFAAGVAALSFVSMMRSIGALVAPAPRWSLAVVGALFVGVGWLGWVWWSGMEVALFGALVARGVLATQRARDGVLAPGARRAALASRAGLWLAACVLVRPEAVVVAPFFAVVAGRGAKDRSGLALAARVAVPPALATAAVALVNRALTGSFMSAGAELKLVTQNPYLTDVGRAREVVSALLHFEWKIAPELGALGGVLAGLAAVSVVARRRRGVAVACLGAAAAYALVASVNGAARFQNFRYYAPAAILVLVACAVGASALARVRGVGAIAALATLAGALSGYRASAPEVAHFARSAGEIEHLHVEMGRWLYFNTSEADVLLVGDAGAIPYVSTRRAVDALGLGGYHGVPFARAAPHGEAAMLELVERLPPAERPTQLVLFPSWFPETTSRFGKERLSLTVADPVMVGGPSKVAYAADFGPLKGPAGRPTAIPGGPALGPPVFELDVADVISEAESNYVHPAPFGGFTRVEVREGTFDGGRVVPEGRAESFDLRAPAAGWLVARLGDGEGEIRIDGAALSTTAPDAGRYRYGWVRAPAGGRRVTVVAARGAFVSYHYWLFAGE